MSGQAATLRKKWNYRPSGNAEEEGISGHGATLRKKWN
jgi:hypothetical protein